MAEGDVVRKITISATGENIDSTTASVKSLGDATTKTTSTAGNAKSSFIDLAAGIYVAKSAYEAMSTASDGASSSLGRSTAAITAAIGAVLAYAPNKFGEIWQEGIDKLNSYVELSQKAGSLSTDYYQRLTKGATDAKKPADEYLKVIENINKALDRRLGTDGNQNGSALNTEVLELQKNGNLQGQTAEVNRVNNAVTGPEQVSASIKLIEAAAEAGEKLIAFKLTNTLLGPEVEQRFRNNNDALHQMGKSIESVQGKDIIAQSEIDRAVAMKTVLEDSQKIIDSWFTKASSDWSGLGIGIQQLWVNANQNIASVLTWLEKILGKTQEIANVKPDNPENSIWTKFGDLFATPEGMTRMNDADRQLGAARMNITSRLGNGQNITNAQTESQKADDWRTPDQSSPPPPPPDPKPIKEYNDAVDRAINSLTKHIETQKADTLAIGLGDGALAGFKVTAAETAAKLANNGKETADQANQFAQLKIDATNAADALAKARVASEISRGRQTAFLSPEDLAIANQLKGIFGDNIPAALNSSQAAALRFNNVLKSINDTARSSVESFATNLVHGLEQGQQLMAALASAAKSLGQSLIDTGLKSLLTTAMNALTGAGSGAASGAALATGGTSAAAAITAACTAGGAALAAGGAAAGTAIGAGGTVAGVGIDVGTSVGGATLVTAGTGAGVAVAAGGTAAGLALWGPIAALAAVVAGIGLSLMGNSDKAAIQKANEAVQGSVMQQNADAAARQLQDQRNQAAATLGMNSDPNSLNGQLQAFDLQAQQQRQDEAKAGNGAIVELEKSLATQRLAIIQKSNDAIAKTMEDFLNSIKTGSLSTLSAGDQLAYEQNLFSSQVSGAKSGNADDLNALTTTASALLTLAQNFYASGTGYADVYKNVTDAITSIANNPNGGAYADAGVTGAVTDTAAGWQVGSSDGKLTQVATQYGQALAEGGIVGNGIYNRDSVTARYAGGGNIALAGGEHVTRATSVNANTRSSLDYINRTGKAPGNDNTEVVRVLTQGFNGQTAAIVDAIGELSARMKSLENTTRSTNNQRRVPGTQKAG